MRTGRAVCVGAALLLLGGAVAAFAFRDHLFPVTPPGPPVLCCPDLLDLGRQEVATVAAGNLTVSNPGGSPLVIDQVRTGCSCTGLERMTEDGPRRVESLTLPPGGSVELTVRVSVPGPVGQQFATVVYFRTNDPNVPEGRFAVVVPVATGGVRADPSAVAFGLVPPGTAAERVVELRDYALEPRTVRSVAVSADDRVTAELLPPPPPDPAADPRAGVTVARVRVRLRTDAPGAVAGKILVVLDGPAREPDVVPVSGRVVGPVEVTPASLVLPLVAGDGKPVARAVCSLSAGWKPFTLEVAECPAGLTATVTEPGPDGGVRRVAIELAAGAVPAGRTETRTVRLRAVVGGETVTLDVPVLCRGL
ncbi:MAG: hypothetical protein C0501_15560 [Isosphaera sp.]|nr:hypothetical protein [Isosphaera sp.]